MKYTSSSAGIYKRSFIVNFLLIIPITVFCQSDKMTLEEYEPTSTLVVKQHLLTSSKFPFIDIHSHHPYMADQDLNELIIIMDSMNMKLMVNLSGRWGNYLEHNISNIERNNLSSRIVVFTNIDFRGFGMDGWTEAWVEQIKMDHANGAKGLKIFKELGMTHKDELGMRIKINDPRLGPIWEVCGELEMPVLIHSGAPRSFWEPLDEKNERWLEMYIHKDRNYNNSNLPTWEQIMEEQHDMFSKHSNTIFINAHFGWYGNDLEKLAKLLDDMPNMYIEFGAVISELGRQPRAARKFFDTYQDRILFGKDSWVPSEYMTYFRVLETEDEYFPYHKKYHAFWRMYGMGLSDQILKKIYYKNALNLIPSIDRTLFPD